MAVAARALVLLVALCGLEIPRAQAGDNRELVIASSERKFEGPYRAWIDAFEAQYGARVRLVDYDAPFFGDAPGLRQRQSTSKPWDLIDVSVPAIDGLCAAGVLQRIPEEILPAGVDGTPAAQDFYPGTLAECGVANLLWTTLFVFEPNAFSGSEPQTIADAFDVERFPGRRAMMKWPFRLVEMALMAGGVPPERVYAELATAAGRDRAFAELAQIRGHIVWLETNYDAVSKLNTGEAVFAHLYSGALFDARLTGIDIRPIWDGQVYTASMWGLLEGAGQPELARNFIRFTTSSESSARQTRWAAWGPVRRSSLPFVGDHAASGEPMLPHLLNAPANFSKALAADYAFWLEHHEDLNRRFEALFGEFESTF